MEYTKAKFSYDLLAAYERKAWRVDDQWLMQAIRTVFMVPSFDCEMPIRYPSRAGHP